MNKYIKILIILMVSLVISCGEKNNTPESLKDYFINANQASLKVNDATYTAIFDFKTDRESQSSKLDISIKRDKNSKLGFVVKFKVEGGEGLYDGNKYYFKDDKIKKVYISGEEIKPEMFITSNWIISAINMIMLDKDYSEDIKKRKDEMINLGEAKSGIYNTAVIESRLPVPKSKIVTKIKTYFDMETNLPVKEIKTQTDDERFMTQSLEIVNLKLNPNLTDSEFVMNTPDGYVAEIITPETEPQTENAGEPAPDFTLKDLTGKPTSLSSLKGNVVVLDFWGTWCHWCVKAMPKLQNVHDHFKGKKVIVLGISCNEKPDASPKKFLEDNKITYNSLLYGEDVALKYKVSGYPTLYIIGKDGKIITSKSGFSETMDKEIIEIINKNL